MITYNRARRWRNFLLAVAVIALVLAWLQGFRLSRAVVSRLDRTVSLLILTASLYAATGIRQIAGQFSDMAGESWYGRATAVGYIAIMLAIIMGMVHWVTQVFFSPYLPGLSALEQLVLFGVGFTVVWIIIGDWPRGKKFSACTTVPTPIPPDYGSISMPEPQMSPPPEMDRRERDQLSQTAESPRK